MFEIDKKVSEIDTMNRIQCRLFEFEGIPMLSSSNANTQGFWPDHVSAGEIVYPPGGCFGPRMQHYLQLVIVHTGHLTVWINEEPHAVPENTVFLLFPGHKEYFAFAEERETHHSWLHIMLPQIPAYLLERFLRLEWSLPLSLSLNRLIHEALQVQVTPFPTAQEILKALAVQMLWRYLGEGEQRLPRAAAPLHPLVEQARMYIHAHLDETLTLERIAGVVAISPAYLIRLFQAHLHTTPMHYLWQQRVAKGVELLEQTGLAVSAIAERCGFVSRYHFSRRIRETVGASPQEVRRRSWQRPV